MTILVFLPEGRTREYPDASGWQLQNGVTTFFYQPDAGKRQDPKTKKVTTTLPVLVEEEVGAPRG
jgi:hypothetical protein